MKMLNHVHYFVLVTTLVFSCQKHKQLEGDYMIHFRGVATSSLGDSIVNHSNPLFVKESKKHYIHFGWNDYFNFILSKDGDEAYGTFPYEPLSGGNGVYYYYGPYQLTGTWSIKYGKYRIVGTYEGVLIRKTGSPNYSQTVYQETGEFEIIVF